jgi:antitoxin ChpS
MTALKSRLGSSRPRRSARKLARKAAPKAIKPESPRKEVLPKSASKTRAKVKAKRVVVRKVGGSLMAAVPADVVKDMGLAAGRTLAVAYDGKRLILAPTETEPRRYTLRQILASCNFDLPKTVEELEWEAAPRVGREAL